MEPNSPSPGPSAVVQLPNAGVASKKTKAIIKADILSFFLNISIPPF